MSSYLNLYLKPKKGEDKKLRLISSSRNSDVYERFHEEGVTFIGYDEGEEKYTKIDTRFLDNILSEVNADIAKWEKRISEYRKHANGNADIINEIIEYDEYLEELKNSKWYFIFLRDIVKEIEDGYTSFEGMYANID